MLTVRNILKVKGDEVWSVSPDATVLEALHVLADRDIGAVLVMEKERVVGILSERDVVRETAKVGQCRLDEPVRNLMSTHVLYVGLDNTIEDCMALMTEKRIRHLPVIENGKLVGIVSNRDVVSATIMDRDLTIENLEKYITGGGYSR